MTHRLNGDEKMNLYLKSLLVFGPFGILMGILGVMAFGFSFGMKFGILFSLLILGIVFVSSFTHIKLSERMHPEDPDEVHKVHHVREIELSLPFNDAFNLCNESLTLFDRCAIVKKDLSQGKIVAEIGPSLWSAGQVISFDIQQTNAWQTRIMFSSKPFLRTNIIDFGRNLKNVEKIAQYLREKGGT